MIIAEFKFCESAIRKIANFKFQCEFPFCMVQAPQIILINYTSKHFIIHYVEFLRAFLKNVIANSDKAIAL